MTHFHIYIYIYYWSFFEVVYCFMRFFGEKQRNGFLSGRFRFLGFKAFVVLISDFLRFLSVPCFLSDF